MKIRALPAILPAALTVASTLATSHLPPDNIPLPISNHSSTPETNETAPSFTFGELFQLQKKFLDAFIYPANQAQAKSINASILAPDVQGRVDITRTFNGAELNTEYLFGLFANLASTPSSFTLLGIPTAYQITHFAASGNIVAASTRFNFTFPLLPQQTLPLQIDTWNAFNARGQIAQYDATFKWWSWTVDTLFATAASAANVTVPQLQRYARVKLANSICDTAVRYCNGSVVDDKRDLYDSREECVKYLSTGVRFGESWELGRNTLLCRMVHQNMVPLRPATHCAHIGPTGGGYCGDEKGYVQTVEEGYFTNFPFVGGLAT